MGDWNFGLGMTPAQEEEYKRKLWASLDEEARSKIFSPLGGDDFRIKPGAGGGPNEIYSAMLGEEKSRLLGKSQKLFDIAAEGGAKDGGPAISGGGTSGIGYAPQRDITKTFPGAMSKEEEEYLLALRGPVPGMMTYRGMS